MCGRLVEYDDPGSLEQQPRDRQPLPLATREPVAAVADHGVEPVGHAATRVAIRADSSADQICSSVASGRA